MAAHDPLLITLVDGADGTPRLNLSDRSGTPYQWAGSEGLALSPVVEVGGKSGVEYRSSRKVTDGYDLLFRHEVGLELTVRLRAAHDHPVCLLDMEVANPTSEAITSVVPRSVAPLCLDFGAGVPEVTYVLGWLDIPRIDAPGRPPAPFHFGNWLDTLLYDGDCPETPPLPPAGWNTPTMRTITEKLFTLPLRSGKRGSYTTFPWVAVRSDARDGGLFAGYLWSGSWRMDLVYSAGADGGVVTLSAGTDGYVHTLAAGERLAVPQLFLGFYQGGWDAAANATRAYTREEVLPPSPDDFPPVHTVVFPGAMDGPPADRCYFPERGDDFRGRMAAMVHKAKEIGSDSFLLDACWWESWPGTGDFSIGLGDFRESRRRFPDGIRAVSDLVHKQGMRFGLWFEFERVDIRTAGLGRNPWRPEWLVHRDGYPYRSWGQHFFNICLGHRPAAEWALENLEWAVREYGVDWFMIDSNEWAVCTDPSHTHGAEDGEWAQIHGLYSVLTGLRGAFPELIIDNSAGGGQRADFGLARFCNVMPCSDVNSPSITNRQYAYGYGWFYPTSYFRQGAHSYPSSVTGPVSKANPYPWQNLAAPLAGDPTLSLERFEWRLLCRILGVFQPTFDISRLTDGEIDVLKRVISTYKAMRSTLHGDRYVIAAPPVFVERENRESGSWEAYQFVAVDRRTASVVAYRPGGAASRLQVRLQGLEPTATYRVHAHTGAVAGSFAGSELMDGGLPIVLTRPRSAEVIVLTRTTSRREP